MNLKSSPDASNIDYRVKLMINNDDPVIYKFKATSPDTAIKEALDQHTLTFGKSNVNDSISIKVKPV